MCFPYYFIMKKSNTYIMGIAVFALLTLFSWGAEQAFAITVDTTASYQGSTEMNQSFTVGSCNDRVLLISLGDVNSGPSTFTFNGVNVPRIIRSVANKEAAIYELINPDTGAHNVVSSGIDGSSVVGILSLCDVDQTQSGVASTTGTSNNISINTSYDNSYVFESIVSAFASNTSFSQGQTSIINVQEGLIKGGTGYKSTTSSGNYSMDITAISSGDIALLEIQTAGGSSSGSSSGSICDTASCSYVYDVNTETYNLMFGLLLFFASFSLLIGIYFLIGYS